MTETSDTMKQGCVRLAMAIGDALDLVGVKDICDTLASDAGLRGLVEFADYIAQSPPREYGGFSREAIENAQAALRQFAEGTADA